MSKHVSASACVIAALALFAQGCAQAEAPRRWLGREFWANRLQDWRFANGRLECLADNPRLPVRTAFVLTREVKPRPGKMELKVRTGLLNEPQAGGSAGFLVGIGQGRLDYRAAKLVHHLSGEGGGILALFQSDGRCVFRDHTSESSPSSFGLLRAKQVPKEVPVRPSAGQEFELTLTAEPAKSRAGHFDLTLAARSLATGRIVSKATLPGVAEKEILGGIALVSHPRLSKGAKGPGARFWFRDFRSSGQKVRVYPERAWGPVAGTLFSLNGKVLRLNAQFMPLGPSAHDKPGEYVAARLEYRPARGARDWQQGPVADIRAPSQTALFRIGDWDARRGYEYRVVPLRPNGSAAPEALRYYGRIPPDPVDRDELIIAAFTGNFFMGRPCDALSKPKRFDRAAGRYTPEMMWVPHTTMLRALEHHRPDVMFFTGDQIYQGVPTRVQPPPCPADDFLYKWLHWVDSYRRLTRRIPTVVQTDDHDVYQGNIWGWSGRKCPSQRNSDGGYIYSPEFVNMVERCMCAGNPDPYDPRPIQRGIGVYFCSFKYGGVSFAVLEDRKFKTPKSVPQEEGVLLGPRQEKFLAEWGRDRSGAVAKVVVSQTTYASVGTDARGLSPPNHDTNGFPKPGRDRAVRLIRDAGAICIAGDQHLATVVVQGLESHDDGFVQFMVPAVGSTFQRWWAPARPGEDRKAGSPPYTGNFTDAFGNRFRVLAAASPAISKLKTGGPIVRSRRLTKTGYGIVRVDKKTRHFILECWPGEAHPAAKHRQFPGWPIRVPFPKGKPPAGGPAK